MDFGDVRITLGSGHPGWPSGRLLCADIGNRPRHVRYGPESNIQAEACATANLLLRLFNLDSAARTDSRRVKNHLAVLCHRVMGDLRWFN